jgi:hypothetical protein
VVSYCLRHRGLPSVCRQRVAVLNLSVLFCMSSAFCPYQNIIIEVTARISTFNSATMATTRSPRHSQRL